MARKYSKKASANVERAMKKRKAGTLKSGRSGKKVKSRKQAIAIGLSEARAKGKKVPKKAARKRNGEEIAALVRLRAKPIPRESAGATNRPAPGKSVPIFGNHVKRKICPNRKYFCFTRIQISAT